MKNILWSLGLVALLGSLCSGQTVLNGSFELGVAPPFGGTYVPAPDSTTINNWTVQSGSVDYIGSDTWQAADGNRSLDLNGHGTGTIMQSITGFIPGEQYRLSFYMAGNNEGVPLAFSLRAGIGTASALFTFDATGHTYTNMGWSLQTMDFAATNTTMPLTFTSLEAGFAGPALDNVSITPIPKPSVEMLLAQVNSQVSNAHPLGATLSAALRAIERNHPAAAVNQLSAFQKQVRAQVSPLDAALAEDLIQMAQEIIEELVAESNARGKP